MTPAEPQRLCTDHPTRNDYCVLRAALPCPRWPRRLLRRKPQWCPSLLNSRESLLPCRCPSVITKTPSHKSTNQFVVCGGPWQKSSITAFLERPCHNRMLVFKAVGCNPKGSTKKSARSVATDRMRWHPSKHMIDRDDSRRSVPWCPVGDRPTAANDCAVFLRSSFMRASPFIPVRESSRWQDGEQRI